MRRLSAPTGEGAIEGGSVNVLAEEQSLTGEGAIEGRGRCEELGRGRSKVEVDVAVALLVSEQWFGAILSSSLPST